MLDLLKKSIDDEVAFTERLKALNVRLETMLENQKVILAARNAEINVLEREINDIIFDQKRVGYIPSKPVGPLVRLFKDEALQPGQSACDNINLQFYTTKPRT
jgi:hypothetical protein